MASRTQRYVNDLGFRADSIPPLIFDKITYFLKGFDTLVVCARALGEDANLTSLLTRIDQVLTRNADIIELHCRRGLQGEVPLDLFHDLKSFENEIDGWYFTLSNLLHLQSPTGPALIDVIEIIDSVLEDLQNFHRLEFSDTGDDTEGMEEKMQLFRNLIEFVEMLNVDEHQNLELQGFVIQVASVAVSAACVCAHLYSLLDAWNVQGWKQVKHKWKQIQPEILALLTRIRPNGLEVSQAYKIAMSISKSSEELRYSIDLDSSHHSLVIIIKDFIDFLLWCLWETLEMDCCVGDFMKNQVRPLWGGLKFLRAHAHEFAEEEVRNFSMVICNAETIIFSLNHQDAEVAGLVENLEMIMVQIKEQIQGLEFEQQVPETLMEQEKVGTAILPGLAPDPVVARMKEESKNIITRLTRGSKGLEFIPIVGMAGLGKTTLAVQVYNHPQVRLHFSCRAWCTVSHVYNFRGLVLELLNQICPDWSLHHRFCQDANEDEDDLYESLGRYLKGKRYFVVLDDVWDSEVWNRLNKCFPDDRVGSRILLTSRDTYVIPTKTVPYPLRPRSDFESLEILRKKLFPEDDFPAILHELGMRIAGSCKGLPMTIVTVAGLLTTLKPDVWKKVLESLDSNTLSRTEQFIGSSELSYRYLPDHLKLCFLSFRLFPEKEEVSAKWLQLLWIAEGLILETEGKKIEDVAMQYMNDLVNKSLVFVTKTTSLGGVRTCRVHESIYGFCIRKAEEKAFSHVLKGYDDILAVNMLHGSQKLCIQSSRRDFKSLRLCRPGIHSLLFLPLKDTLTRVVEAVSFIVRVFQSLRVLHIMQMDLGEVFPVEMKLLVELRYLAVRGRFVDIPSSIGSLLNLHTLILDSHLEVAFPGTIWDLQNLRHLCIENGFHFPFDNLDDSSDLFQLESCSVVIVESWDILKKFPNVSKLKLKCRILDTINIDMPDCLHGLESLHVSTSGVVQHCHQFLFNFASKLGSLTLKDMELSEGAISAVGKLPCLESLKLLHVSFCGGGLHMKEEDDFQKLKYFKFSDSNILSWTATEHQLWSLEKLVLQRCLSLEQIPMNCLRWLKAIEVFDCSPSVELQLKEIQEMKEI